MHFSVIAIVNKYDSIAGLTHYMNDLSIRRDNETQKCIRVQRDFWNGAHRLVSCLNPRKVQSVS